MTIFDILHITPPDYPVTFHNGQFYAYKDMLIDLHSEKLIELQPLTQNNTLLIQLDVDIYNESIYCVNKTIVEEDKNSMYPQYTSIQYLTFDIHINNELKINYQENSDEVIITHHKPLQNSRFETEILSSKTIKLK